MPVDPPKLTVLDAQPREALLTSRQDMLACESACFSPTAPESVRPTAEQCMWAIKKGLTRQPGGGAVLVEGGAPILETSLFGFNNGMQVLTANVCSGIAHALYRRRRRVLCSEPYLRNQCKQSSWLRATADSVSAWHNQRSGCCFELRHVCRRRNWSGFDALRGNLGLRLRLVVSGSVFSCHFGQCDRVDRRRNLRRPRQLQHHHRPGYILDPEQRPSHVCLPWHDVAHGQLRYYCPGSDCDELLHICCSRTGWLTHICRLSVHGE
jgi:hypothetical protein